MSISEVGECFGISAPDDLQPARYRIHIARSPQVALHPTGVSPSERLQRHVLLQVAAKHLGGPA